MRYIWSNIYPTTHLWSVCYLDENKKLSAIELERIDRYKNSPNLSSFSLIKEVEEKYKNNFLDYFDLDRKNLKTLNFDSSNTLNRHHYLHACSVYFSNNINESAILCMDRNWFDSELWNQFQTIWDAKDNNIKNIYSTKINSQKDRGIGFAYYIISEFLKLWEWSVMGLSAYWNKDYYNDIKIYDYRNDWVYINKIFLEWITFEEVENIDFYKKYDILDEVEWNREIIFTNIQKYFWINIKDIEKAENDILNSKFIHIAMALQFQTEEAIIYLANKAYELTWSKNLCLAWWVALNILANTRILKETKFENIYISPVSEDIWLALWSFYYLYYIQEWNNYRIELNKTGYWKEYSDTEVLKDLEYFWEDLAYSKHDMDEIYELTTDKLIQNEVIWWFQWWSEFWPRSLGNRSIIASPSSNELRDKVNKIKSRELWRPLAPSVLEEDIWEYFDISYLSKFMNFSWNIKKDKIDTISWVVHIDNTSRYQSVSKENNYEYYNLINNFKRKTGISMIINTSMNVSKEPIVESPIDAIKMFLTTDLDYLVINNFFIKKNKNVNKYKFNYESVRLKRNLLFEDNKKVLFKIKKLQDYLTILFWNIGLSFDTHFYDKGFWFFINGEKYILELYVNDNIYLYTDKIIWLTKEWLYNLADEEIVLIISNNNSYIYELLKDNNYYLKDI